jgi:hypothetical protein
VSAFRTLRAQVRRRILVSYRLDPLVVQRLVPDPFRAQLVNGSAVAGVCMIGLQDVRPGWMRRRVGFSTENVAHRIAVEWEQDGELRSGVYIVERHSSSLLPVLGGGRLFPGVQRRAKFSLNETDDRFIVAMTSPEVTVEVDVEVANAWSSELFATVEDASAFHERGSVGWSPRRDGRGVESLELTSTQWKAEGAVVHSIHSSFFDALPRDSATLDSALVMRDLPFFWDTPASVPRMVQELVP